MNEIIVNVYNDEVNVGVEEIIETVTIIITENAGVPSDAPIETISKNGTQLPITAKNVDITVPTKTSELEKDDVYTKTEVNNKLSAVYKYKGSILTYDLLPTDAENADVWNVINGTTPELNGMNYAWNSTLSEWDELGGIIGLATLTENGLLSKEDFAALAALKIHNHSGQSINPDNVVLNKQYTDIDAEDLQVGTIFYNIDQKCWLLKLSSVNYYNFGEELPVLSRIGDDQNHLEGQACFISGGSTQLNNVSLASSVTGKLNCLATQDVLNTGDKTGYYCYFGQVRKFPYANVIKSTDNASTWVDGADLYLCNEAGKYSTVKEAAPAKASYVGRITNRNGANITVMFIPVEAKATTDLSDWDGNTNAFADAEKILIRKTNGLVQEMTKTDFYAILDDYFAKLSGGNVFSNGINNVQWIKDFEDAFYNQKVGLRVGTIAGVDFGSNTNGYGFLKIFRGAGSTRVYFSAHDDMYIKKYDGTDFLEFDNIKNRFGVTGIVNINGTQYFGESKSGDAINDRKESVSPTTGVKSDEICTGNSATKGNGTWIKKRIDNATKSLTNNTLISLLDINVAIQTMQIVRINYSIVAKDAATVRSHAGTIVCNVRNQNGVVSSNVLHVVTLESDLGNITDTWTLVDGSGKATLNLTANASGMTPTSMLIYMDIECQGSNNTILL